jgi:hypothetical protein
LFAYGQAIISEMESDLQQALHILHAILKYITLKYPLKQPKPWDLKEVSTLDKKQLLTPQSKRSDKIILTTEGFLYHVRIIMTRIISYRVLCI